MKVPEGGLCGLVRGSLILIDGLISFSKGIIGFKFLLDKQLIKHKLQSKLSRLKYHYLHHSSTNQNGALKAGQTA